MDQLRRDQDSVGARISVVAEGMPVGLGEPVFDRLDAELAHGLMSINAVKGVEIGDETVRRTVMLEQITASVESNPEEVAHVLRRWVRTES